MQTIFIFIWIVGKMYKSFRNCTHERIEEKGNASQNHCKSVLLLQMARQLNCFCAISFVTFVAAATICWESNNSSRVIGYEFLESCFVCATSLWFTRLFPLVIRISKYLRISTIACAMNQSEKVCATKFCMRLKLERILSQIPYRN